MSENKIKNGGIIVHMPDSGLPKAVVSSQKNVRIGNITIKTEKPTQTYAEAEQGIKSLEKAAKERIFTKNEPSE